MANTTGLREALAFIAENSEVFSQAVNKKTGTLDVGMLEKLAVRGDAQTILARKFEKVSEESRITLNDTLDMLASDVLAGCAVSGTSKNQQFKIPTPSGMLQVTLSDQPK